MKSSYSEIVFQWYESLKTPFMNFLAKNFVLRYDDIMDIYAEVWISVRENICKGNVQSGTKWKAYIFKMGWNKASNMALRRPSLTSIDDERFDRERFEREYTEGKEAETSIYEDPELQSVLSTELSYIPDPCNKVLKLYYFDELSMGEIADIMNYKGARTAITTKTRCMEKLKTRVLDEARRIGIIQ